MDMIFGNLVRDSCAFPHPSLVMVLAWSEKNPIAKGLHSPLFTLPLSDPVTKDFFISALNPCQEERRDPGQWMVERCV